MRFKAFNARYKSLATPMKNLHRTDSKSVEDCEFILDCYSKQVKTCLESNSSQDNINRTHNKDWAHGRKHIFLSEGARQQLELLRDMKRQKSANLIQNYWKSHKSRKQQIKKQHNTNSNNNNVIESVKNGHDQNLNLLWHHSRRPKPISGTPPPLDVASGDKCDFKTIQQTCSLFGLDLERPPPVPPSRPYTVFGSKKITFPQSRIMKNNYLGTPDIELMKGEQVIVIGHSSLKGHLVVERNNHTIHVPFRYLELKKPL